MYERIVMEETDLHVASRVPVRDEVISRVAEARNIINGYINGYPEFKVSLEPMEARPGAHEIIAGMCREAKKAGVGPMASVAGAIAKFAGEAIRGEIIIENGGDIYIKSEISRKVMVYAGNSPLSGKFAVTLAPGVWGVASSAGTFGHSVSFGRADAAMVVSRDAVLSDAAATGLGNRLKSAADIESALDWVLGIAGVTGALCVVDGRMGIEGDIVLGGI